MERSQEVAVTTLPTSAVPAVQVGPRSEPFAHATPTIDAVARHAGVSRQTVSNVLNAPSRVRPDTIERVRAAIDALGYRANSHARNLRTRTSKVLGYRIPASDAAGNSVLDQFLHALTDEAVALGYRILLFTADSVEQELDSYWELTAQSAVDGIVLAQTDFGDVRPAWLLARGLPFVSFGRTWGSALHSWVDVDSYQGTKTATEHLLRAGHKRFAWVDVGMRSAHNGERHRGVADALDAAVLPADHLVRVDLGSEPSANEHVIGALLDGLQPPTAFVAMSDLQALPVLAACERRGLVPGRDVAVVGFDDSPVAAFAGGGLTSIRQPIGAAARALVRLLTAQCADPERPAESVLLVPELIVRRTG